MAKLSLKIDPTFPATVDIPKAGGDPVQIRLIFKHRTKDEVAEFTGRVGTSDVDSILDMATGWDLEDAFNAENVGVLCQNYIMAPMEIYRKYIDELVKAKAKN